MGNKISLASVEMCSLLSLLQVIEFTEFYYPLLLVCPEDKFVSLLVTRNHIAL